MKVKIIRNALLKNSYRDISERKVLFNHTKTSSNTTDAFLVNSDNQQNSIGARKQA